MKLIYKRWGEIKRRKDAPRELSKGILFYIEYREEVKYIIVYLLLFRFIKS